MKVNSVEEGCNNFVLKACISKATGLVYLYFHQLSFGSWECQHDASIKRKISRSVKIQSPGNVNL